MVAKRFIYYIYDAVKYYYKY